MDHVNKKKVILFMLIICVEGDYWDTRSKMIQLDENSAVGVGITLNAKEKIANNILMKYKTKELDEAYKNPVKNYAIRHFFHSKPYIEHSNVFKFIQMLPKGGSLHSHHFAMSSTETINRLMSTYQDNLFVCVNNSHVLLHYFETVDETCDWQLVTDLRNKNATFDKFLKSRITLTEKNPTEIFASKKQIWQEFESVFHTLGGFLSYKPVFQEHFYQTLKEMYDDNVMYLEFRSTFPTVYDLTGKQYSHSELLDLLYEVGIRFKRDFPLFAGFKVIFAPRRSITKEVMRDVVNITKELEKKHRHIFAGLDLVGNEDQGFPLKSFVEELVELEGRIKFFFHAAETNWNGFNSDFNIFDAILLNSTRIGHGYAIIKHPQALKMLKQRQIALEICPISNQVLGYVSDFRNHPASLLLSDGFPVVICADDPALWGSKALSFDWFVAFMALASRKTDLRLLKQLAKNSLLYSAMDDDEKRTILIKWEKQWDIFIEKVIIT